MADFAVIRDQRKSEQANRRRRPVVSLVSKSSHHRSPLYYHRNAKVANCVLTLDRKRTVKCDETKPECLRCQNFGCACDGYEFPSNKVARVVAKRPLVPKNTAPVQMQTRRPSTCFWFDQMIGGKHADAIHQALVDKSGDLGSLLKLSSTTIPYKQLQLFVSTDNPASSITIYAPSTNIFENDQEKQ